MTTPEPPPGEPGRRPGDHLSKAEIRKDSLQSAVEAATGTVAEVTTIVTTAVRQVAGAVGGLATELFEIRDSARKAAAEHGHDKD